MRGMFVVSAEAFRWEEELLRCHRETDPTMTLGPQQPRLGVDDPN